MIFLKKIKNNKGSAESAMFVMGIAIFATIVIFAMDIFGLTWQRYLSTRELSNMSRLYAIRATDLYIKDQSTGTIQGIVTQPNNSDLGKEMKDIMNTIVTHGKLTKATLTIKNSGGVTLLTITSSGGNSNITAAGYDTIKNIQYGDTLFATLKVEYKKSKITSIAKQTKVTNSYEVKNKFAYEQFAHNNTNIG